MGKKSKFRRYIEAEISQDANSNLFNEEFVPNYATKENLDKFYQAYLYNLRINPNEMLWLTLDEIEDKPVTQWSVIGDQYLKNNSSIDLAKDIIENGTYWPLFVNRKEGKIVLNDGIHRLNSLKMAQREGLWPKNKKVLAFVRTNKKYEEPGKYIIPSPLAVDHKLLGFFYKYYRAPILDPSSYTDESRLLCYREDRMGDAPLVIFALLMRNAIYEYNKYGLHKFQGAKVINNEEAFYKWRGKHEIS
jgi:hypothetical protein